MDVVTKLTPGSWVACGVDDIEVCGDGMHTVRIDHQCCLLYDQATGKHKVCGARQAGIGQFPAAAWHHQAEGLRRCEVAHCGEATSRRRRR